MEKKPMEKKSYGDNPYIFFSVKKPYPMFPFMENRSFHIMGIFLTC